MRTIFDVVTFFSKKREMLVILLFESTTLLLVLELSALIKSQHAFVASVARVKKV